MASQRDLKAEQRGEFEAEYFTGQTPFLSPNQHWCQRAEGEYRTAILTKVNA